MANVNKYCLDWQIVRMRARKERSVAGKVALVKEFVDKRPTAQNILRAENWARMTILGYRGKRGQETAAQELGSFINALNVRPLDEYEELYNFQDYSREELMELYSDLKKRRWNFQYKKAPQSHDVFMERLEEALQCPTA